MNQPPEVFDRASLFELVTGYNPCRYIRVTREATATEKRKKVLERERERAAAAADRGKGIVNVKQPKRGTQGRQVSASVSA